MSDTSAIKRKNDDSSYKLINDISFCVFDLETTGGNHETDKIIEIGMVKLENMKITQEKNFLIQPEIKIPNFIQKLTSIGPNDVKDAYLIEDVIDEIIKFMGDSILVAHNTSFDIPFLNSVLQRLNRPPLKNNNICTVLMTRYLIPNLLNSNLNYMSKIFGIKHQKAHRALDDARATAKLLLKYLNIFVDKKINKLNHLYYPKNRYELDRINFKKSQGQNTKDIINLLTKLKCSFLVTIKGKNGIILFSLPCHNSPQEKDFIEKVLSETNWQITSIRLFGPFLEALVHFNNYFCKLEQEVRNRIMNFLWEEHLSDSEHFQKPSNIEESKEGEDFGNLNFGHFIITNHLVPEQLIIYPLISLHQKSSLIFRYPGHKKKLLQYINSKYSRIKNNKLKKTFFHPSMKKFTISYIKSLHEKQKEIFIFKRSLIKKNDEEFFTKLDNFLSKNPPTYNYPKEYI